MATQITLADGTVVSADASKEYICKVDEDGKLVPVSPITHSSTVYDTDEEKYLDTIISELKSYIGYPITTSLNITEEGKYAADASAVKKLKDLYEKVFQSANNMRSYLAHIVGETDANSHNLTSISDKLRETITDYSDDMVGLDYIENESGTLSGILKSLQATSFRKHEYTINLTYNDITYSKDKNKSYLKSSKCGKSEESPYMRYIWAWDKADFAKMVDMNIDDIPDFDPENLIYARLEAPPVL